MYTGIKSNMAAPSQGLFSWGANSYGQLGIGNTTDKFIPQRVESFPSEAIKCIKGGGGHSVVVAKSGNVYVCGWNSKGQLGLGHRDNQLTFQKISGIPAISDVSCGWEHTLAITENGKLYSWGGNNFRQLGHNQENLVETPKQVQAMADYTIVDIAAGLRHSVALTNTGKVWVWGAGSKGQLGILIQGNIPSLIVAPQQVPLPNITVKQVACGSFHSIAVTDDDKLMVWGCNKRGQLGELPYVPDTGEGTENISQPKQLPSIAKNITRVISGWNHCIIQTCDGSLFSWGRADYGQLGRIPEVPMLASQPYAEGCCYIPKPVEFEEKASQIACGSEHCLALTVNIHLYAWGWNEHGTCGDGSTTNVYTPKLVPDIEGWRAVLIGAGYGHCFIMCEQK
ncbi:secretion-regulating guanine nucleotide exchange factor-like [Anneissia japonica]|uniref:secretion-regulating guanine nucleotide exchange factor-like n=1 Tax=Anneissia japonica TaxID=1529436 RepID=UPI0014257FD2|nr:secretion-regulating guanine nucleotide exchange factor-like [Anneissia japonica]